MLIDLNANSPFEFVLKWLPTVGWPAILLLVWKARGFLVNFEKKVAAAFDSIVSQDKKTDALLEMVKASLASGVETSASLKRYCELFEAHTRDDDANFQRLFEAIGDHVKSTTEISRSIQQLAEAIHHQSEVHASQFEILRGIADKQSTIAANQNNITSGFQRVVEQLINIMTKS